MNSQPHLVDMAVPPPPLLPESNDVLHGLQQRLMSSNTLRKAEYSFPCLPEPLVHGIEDLLRKQPSCIGNNRARSHHPELVLIHQRPSVLARISQLRFAQ